MTLESSKNLGGIGALLVVLSPLGRGLFSGALGIVGLILMLIGLNGIAVDYKERKIFDNALYGVIVAIVGVVAAIAVIVVTVLATLSSLGINLHNWTNWSQVGNLLRNPANTGSLWGFIGGVVIGLVVLFAFAIVSAMLFRRSLNILSTKTKIDMFHTAGLLMLIGAVLTIVLVGLLLIWVSFILIAVAFFSIKVK
jgi:uncharacterized membrane protein